MAVIRNFIIHIAVILFLNNSNEALFWKKVSGLSKERYSGERFVDSADKDGPLLKKRDIPGVNGVGAFYNNRNDIDSAAIDNIPNVKLDYESIMSKRSNVPDNERAEEFEKSNLPYDKGTIFKKRNVPNKVGMIYVKNKRDVSNYGGMFFEKSIVPDDKGMVFKKRNIPHGESMFFKKRNIPDGGQIILKKTDSITKDGLFYDPECSHTKHKCPKKRNLPDKKIVGFWYLNKEATDGTEKKRNIHDIERAGIFHSRINDENVPQGKSDR